MKAIITTILMLAVCFGAAPENAIRNGVPWFDTDGNIINRIVDIPKWMLE